VFDLRGVSITQFDLNYTIWGIDVLCNKLPSVLRKVLLLELPWLCRPLLKAMLVFVPDEWRKTIQQCTVRDIGKHMDERWLLNADQLKSCPTLGLSADPSGNKSLADFTDAEMIRIGLKPAKRLDYLNVLETMHKIDQKPC
jgi:hypothetical protein